MRKIWFMLSIMLLAPLMAGVALCVMFASDALYLYEDGKKIPDSSVILIINDMHQEVCKNGKVWIRQGPGRLKLIFYRTTSSDIMTSEEWFAAVEGKKDYYGSKYESYLKKKIDSAVYSTEIFMPEPDDKGLSYRPPPGMTGGIIGKTRYFNVDIKNGKIEEIGKSMGKKTGGAK